MGCSTTVQECNAGSKPNAVPHEISVKNTFIEVIPKQPETFKRSVTANVPLSSSSSSSDDISHVNETPQLPLKMDTLDVPATPIMGGLGQSPLAQWLQGAPRAAEVCHDGDAPGSSSSSSDDISHVNETRQLPLKMDTLDIPATPSMGGLGQSPLAQWLQGAPRAAEVCHAGTLQMQDPFAMGPKMPVSVPMYLAVPAFQPVMWQMDPMAGSTMCSSASTEQSAGQLTNVVVPQQAMPIWPQQLNPEIAFGNVPTVATDATPPTTAKNAVWEEMTDWKTQKSSNDDKMSICTDRNSAWMARHWNQPKPRFSNQKPGQHRGKNVTFKKCHDEASDVTSGPRAVFVDLSKIIPTGAL